MSMRTPLGRVRGLGSAKDGTDHFWRQRLTAVANVPLSLFFVFLVIGLAGADYETFTSVIAMPVVAVPLLLVIVSATIHMRLGMQIVIEDYVHHEGLKLLSLFANTFFSILVAGLAGFAVLTISFGG